jgi:hypothetical protein
MQLATEWGDACIWGENWYLMIETPKWHYQQKNSVW